MLGLPRLALSQGSLKTFFKLTSRTLWALDKPSTIWAACLNLVIAIACHIMHLLSSNLHLQVTKLNSCNGLIIRQTLWVRYFRLLDALNSIITLFESFNSVRIIPCSYFTFGLGLFKSKHLETQDIAITTSGSILTLQPYTYFTFIQTIWIFKCLSLLPTAGIELQPPAKQPSALSTQPSPLWQQGLKDEAGHVSFCRQK